MRTFLEIAKALSDEQRVRVLLMLQEGELCLCQIVEALGLAPSTVSKHMTVLSHAGLVEHRKDGRWRYYRLPRAGALPAVDAPLAWVRAALARDATALADRRSVKGIAKKNREDLCGCYKK